MIEITTFGIMVLALISGTLLRDYWRAERDRKRALFMDEIVAQFTSEPVRHLIVEFGDPYELSAGTSGRTLYIWKSPPNQKLPRGSGLLTLVATVETDGIVIELTWRDRG